MERVFAAFLAISMTLLTVHNTSAMQDETITSLPHADRYLIMEAGDQSAEDVVTKLLTEEWLEREAEKETEEETVTEEETSVSAVSEAETEPDETEENTSEEGYGEAEEEPYYIEFSLCYETREEETVEEGEEAVSDASVEKDTSSAADETEEESTESDTEAAKEESAPDPYQVYRLEGEPFPEDFEKTECFEVLSGMPADEAGQYELSFFVEEGAEIWYHYTEEVVPEEDQTDAVQESEEAEEATEAPRYAYWMEPVDTCEVMAEDEETVRYAATLKTGSGHWIVVHLQAEEKEPEDMPEESASASLEGVVDAGNQGGEAGEETAPAVPDTTTVPGSEAPSSATQPATPPASTAAPETTPAPTVPTTPAPTQPPTTAPQPTTPAPTQPPTTAPQPTTPAPTQPPTTAPQPTTPAPTTHSHNWTPVKQVIHHEATYKQVWVEDSPAWDESVLVSEAWDENVLVSEAWDENVLVAEAWDEPIYNWVDICNECGHVFRAGEDVNEHMAAGCWSSWHAEWMQIDTVHHEAVYQVVHHDAVYRVKHHDAVYQVIHHEATGHGETVVDQPAWDETIVTGYICPGCGASR